MQQVRELRNKSIVHCRIAYSRMAEVHSRLQALAKRTQCFMQPAARGHNTKNKAHISDLFHLHTRGTNSSKHCERHMQTKPQKHIQVYEKQHSQF